MAVFKYCNWISIFYFLYYDSFSYQFNHSFKFLSFKADNFYPSDVIIDQ